jgi:translocation and assembly module TamA
MPARGLEIFGVRLWGSAAEEEPIEIIDPLPYAIAFTVATDDAARARRPRRLRALARPRDAGLGLRRPARSRARRLPPHPRGALQQRGHYGPTSASPSPAARPRAQPRRAALPRAGAGRRHRRSRAALRSSASPASSTAPPWEPDGDQDTGPASVDFVPGEPARAGAVTAASALAVERWRQLSHAKAAETDREMIADHAVNRLDATLVMDPGRPAATARSRCPAAGASIPASSPTWPTCRSASLSTPTTSTRPANGSGGSAPSA